MDAVGDECDERTGRRCSLRVRWRTAGSLAEQALFSVCRLVVFAVFNLTMRALFSNRYPLSVVLQDMAWGSLFNMVFTCVYMIVWQRLSAPAEL